MTQTLNRPGPTVAMVTIYPTLQLHIVPMDSVESARDELGGTLADALRFVDATCCTECGTEASETRDTAPFELSCRSCGIPGCRCILTEDPHAPDVWFCSDCAPRCGCRECEG
jgi:hypothetical protein